jgi:hypothetical protein
MRQQQPSLSADHELRRQPAAEMARVRLVECVCVVDKGKSFDRFGPIGLRRVTTGAWRSASSPDQVSAHSAPSNSDAFLIKIQ